MIARRTATKLGVLRTEVAALRTVAARPKSIADLVEVARDAVGVARDAVGAARDAVDNVVYTAVDVTMEAVEVARDAVEVAVEVARGPERQRPARLGVVVAVCLAACAGIASSSGWCVGTREPMKCSPVPAIVSRLSSALLPLSNTSVMSASVGESARQRVTRSGSTDRNVGASVWLPG